MNDFLKEKLSFRSICDTKSLKSISHADSQTECSVYIPAVLGICEIAHKQSFRVTSSSLFEWTNLIGVESVHA